MIFRSLHKLQTPALFYIKNPRWIQIFLLHLDFFIALNIYATAHNGSQLCFKYHSIQHKSTTPF